MIETLRNKYIGESPKVTKSLLLFSFEYLMEFRSFPKLFVSEVRESREKNVPFSRPGPLMGGGGFFENRIFVGVF